MMAGSPVNAASASVLMTSETTAKGMAPTSSQCSTSLIPSVRTSPDPGRGAVPRRLIAVNTATEPWRRDQKKKVLAIDDVGRGGDLARLRAPQADDWNRSKDMHRSRLLGAAIVAATVEVTAVGVGIG